MSKVYFNLYVWNDDFIKLVIDYLSTKNDIVFGPFVIVVSYGLQNQWIEDILELN